MRNAIVVGTQWGDEGKGKLIDYLASKGDFDVAVRAQGGNNAGHTFYVGGEEVITHLVPSAMQVPEITGIMGNGMVLDLEVLVNELEYLQSKGVSFKDRLHISDKAHVIMPYHKYLDTKKDEQLKIGTTKKGIGPVYTHKISRQGIRLVHFKDSKVEDLVDKRIQQLGLQGKFDHTQMYEEQSDLFSKIREYVCDVTPLIQHLISEEKSFLFEGAQGTMLDIDHGTYPAVTSSNSTAGGLITGTGYPMTRIDEIWGIVKAYTTRVGNGAFPTEFGGKVSEEYCAEEGGNRHTKESEKKEYENHNLLNLINSDNEFIRGVALRIAGSEYGATTGRPRRTGWLDGAALRYAAAINGLTNIALTKLDILSDMKTLKICTHYEMNTGQGNKGPKRFDYPPASSKWMEEATPVYKELPGWETDISGIREFDKLPPEAQVYVKEVERIAGVPVSLIGVGPKREDIITRD